MRRLALVGITHALLSLAGCSALVPSSNAGIALLEGSPIGGVATGAKYSGWVAGAPLDLATAPLAALAWATPWVDLALAADFMTAPSVGLGYAFEAAVGLPLYAASFWADERDDPLVPPDAPDAPWGFVTAHRESGPARDVAPLSSDDAAYYAVPPGAPGRLAARLTADGPVPLVGFSGTLELTLADAEGPRPLVLLTPPSEAAFAARWLASRLARSGFHAAVILPDDEVFLDPALDAPAIEAKLRSAVVGARTAIAALASRSDVSGIEDLGVSAGGIFGTVLVAAEPRIERAVLVLPGGDLPRLVAESDEDTVRAYRESWQARGVDAGRAFARSIRTDPARLARHIGPGRVLLFLSDDDTVVPIGCGLELREALGRPETFFLAGNHETSGVCFGFVVRSAEEFLSRSP